ncbi:MAG: RagB/SusD family nutrient uptake outer membrane protein, partial [Muribaculaceae bacterium]
EGRRWDDIRRWKAGHLLLNRWTGMHIAEVNKALDVDRNGTPDVIYYTSDEGLEQAKAAIDWDTYKSTCAAVPVTTDLSASGGVQLVPVGNGYDLAWDCSEDAKRVFADKQYLYPIPAMVITRNPNITQNSGWENGASN